MAQVLEIEDGRDKGVKQGQGSVCGWGGGAEAVRNGFHCARYPSGALGLAPISACLER